MWSTARAGAVWFAAALLVLGGCGAQITDPSSEFSASDLFNQGAKPKSGQPTDNAPVEICHVPPGNPGAAHTINVGAAAVAAHLAHGDRLGPCEQQQPTCDQLDSDGDGVNDCADACAGTPGGEVVDADGCSVLMLRVDAGADVTVTEGAIVNVQAAVEVVQGTVSATGPTWSWDQLAGQTVSFQFNGPSFSFDTMGAVGSFAFRVTVSDAAGASASDDFAVEVLEPEVVYVSAGKWHNAALYNNATIRTWGWGRDGQLGDGSKERGVYDADAAARHTAVVADDGTVWTFGVDALNNSSVPRQVPGAASVVQVAASFDGAALLRDDGTLQAFAGLNGSCLLGGNTSVDENGLVFAADVWGVPANLVEVAAGANHLVALDADGVAWVWGPRFGCTPRAVLTNVVAVAAGDTDLCLFVRADGTAWSLGFNLHGQLGTGNTVSNYTTPRQVVGLSNVVYAAAGDRHSMWVTAEGSLYTAGWNRYCQLGLEDEPTPTAPQYGVTVLAPAQVALAGVVAVGGGELHTVAVTGDGTVWAWGLNNVGQLDGGTMAVLPDMVCTPMALEFE